MAGCRDAGQRPYRKMFDFYNDEGRWEFVTAEKTDVEAVVTTHARPICEVKRRLWREVDQRGVPTGRVFYFTDGHCWLYDGAAAAVALEGGCHAG